MLDKGRALNVCYLQVETVSWLVWIVFSKAEVSFTVIVWGVLGNCVAHFFVPWEQSNPVGHATFFISLVVQLAVSCVWKLAMSLW